MTDASHTIALIDDDRNITTSVSIMLEAEGYVTRIYNDGESGLAGVLKDPPDLIVLDVKMPRMDGIEVLTKLRLEANTPVIFLTSKDDEVDEAIGLRLGADDYVTKPFSQRLLLERIRAVLRRHHPEPLSPAQNSSAPATAQKPETQNGLTLDDARHLCLWQGNPVNLTVTEYLLIKALSSPPGHVKSREELAQAAFGDDMSANGAGDARAIDSHIKRLRKKFRDVDPGFDGIETLYGAGYRYSHD
ncbi:MAG: response regulator transcription factor [Alphaproteobacteria bacterium]|nr:response regulator transcription factor [Alphaproteobacteria bacterium]